MIAPMPTEFAEIDAIFDEYFSQGITLGLAYGVARKGKLIHARGLGFDQVGGNTPTSSSAFRVASIAKSFSSGALLLLRDRGFLNLENPISDYLPELSNLTAPFNDAPAINIRMLMSMSAGFPTDNEWADRLEDLSDAAFGEILQAGIRFDTRPGTKYEYSNLGYALMARIITRVSGKSFVDFVEEEILTPMQLTTSTFDYRNSRNLALGYVKRDGWEIETLTAPGAFSSIGGLVTSVEDLATWSGYLSEAFDPGAAERGPLCKATRRQMQEIQQVIPIIREPNTEHSYTATNGYGFGLRVEEDYDSGKIVGHSGGYPGYGAHFRWHPATGYCVIALTNARYAAPVKACAPALKHLIGSMGRPASSPSPESLLLQTHVNKLIENWDESIIENIFGINMDMDHPRSFRLKKIQEAVQSVGGLKSLEVSDVSTQNASHLSWKLQGNNGQISVEIWLTPNLPAKLQVWTVLPVVGLNT